MTLLIIALNSNIHIFIQAAFYEQLINLSEQHFISQHNSYIFKRILTPAHVSNESLKHRLTPMQYVRHRV